MPTFFDIKDISTTTIIQYIRFVQPVDLDHMFDILAKQVTCTARDAEQAAPGDLLHVYMRKKGEDGGIAERWTAGRELLRSVNKAKKTNFLNQITVDSKKSDTRSINYMIFGNTNHPHRVSIKITGVNHSDDYALVFRLLERLFDHYTLVYYRIKFVMVNLNCNLNVHVNKKLLNKFINRFVAHQGITSHYNSEMDRSVKVFVPNKFRNETVVVVRGRDGRYHQTIVDEIKHAKNPCKRSTKFTVYPENAKSTQCVIVSGTNLANIRHAIRVFEYVFWKMWCCSMVCLVAIFYIKYKKWTTQPSSSAPTPS
jgi:hypothetical protein